MRDRCSRASRSWRRLDPAQGFREQLRLAETLRWVEATPAYRLAYGDLDRAIDWVLSLPSTA